LGASVTGIDPALQNIDVARKHAAVDPCTQGIVYEQAAVEDFRGQEGEGGRAGGREGGGEGGKEGGRKGCVKSRGIKLKLAWTQERGKTRRERRSQKSSH